MSSQHAAPNGNAAPAGTGGTIAPASPGDRPQETGPRADAQAEDAPRAESDDRSRIPDVATPRRQPLSLKSLLALLLVAGFLVVWAGSALQQFIAGFSKPDAEDSQTLRDRPAAASAEPRKLDLSKMATAVGPHAAASAAGAPGAEPGPRVPALVPTEEELAEPIGVRRASTPAQPGPASKTTLPEDAPVMLVSARPIQGPITAGAPGGATPPPGNGRAEQASEPMPPMTATERNLQDYQRRLQGLLDQLTQASDLAKGADASLPPATAGGPGSATPGYTALSQAPSSPMPTGNPPGHQLLGGQLPGSSTPKATASLLGNRSLTLPKGSSFTCALKSRIVTASSGLVGCTVQRNVYGDDGRVLLIERGSHLDGEYRVTAVRPGIVRIPVLWTRVRTPLGVTVELDSPATGQLGESGIDGHVDKRWTERISAAMLLSLIDDSVQLIASNQSEQNRSGTVILPSTSSSTSQLAEKVLDSTINIPPLIYRNQGGIAGIYVARDLDFSSVYELQPSRP